MELILPSDIKDHSVSPVSLPPGQTTGYDQGGGDLLSYHCGTSVRVSGGEDQLVMRAEPISFTFRSSPSLPVPPLAEYLRGSTWGLNFLLSCTIL